jgi:hypothetical protein
LHSLNSTVDKGSGRFTPGEEDPPRFWHGGEVSKFGILPTTPCCLVGLTNFSRENITSTFMINVNTEAICILYVGGRVPDYTVSLRTLKQGPLARDAHSKAGICVWKSRTDSTNGPRNLRCLAGSMAVPNLGFSPVACPRSLISFNTSPNPTVAFFLTAHNYRLCQPTLTLKRAF